jgi:hypothetical protein
MARGRRKVQDLVYRTLLCLLLLYLFSRGCEASGVSLVYFQARRVEIFVRVCLVFFPLKVSGAQQWSLEVQLFILARLLEAGQQGYDQ